MPQRAARIWSLLRTGGAGVRATVAVKAEDVVPPPMRRRLREWHWPRPGGNRTVARAWRGHGAGVARAIGHVWLGVARAWRGHGADYRQFLAWGGAGVARAWRGRGADISCCPSGRHQRVGAHASLVELEDLLHPAPPLLAHRHRGFLPRLADPEVEHGPALALQHGDAVEPLLRHPVRQLLSVRPPADVLALGSQDSGAGMARAWRGCRHVLAWGSAGVARAWRGRGAGMYCDPLCRESAVPLSLCLARFLLYFFSFFIHFDTPEFGPTKLSEWKRGITAHKTGAGCARSWIHFLSNMGSQPGKSGAIGFADAAVSIHTQIIPVPLLGPCSSGGDPGRRKTVGRVYRAALGQIGPASPCHARAMPAPRPRQCPVTPGENNAFISSGRNKQNWQSKQFVPCPGNMLHFAHFACGQSICSICLKHKTCKMHQGSESWCMVDLFPKPPDLNLRKACAWGNMTLARAWRGHGAGCRPFLAWGGAGMARVWRGHVLFPLAVLMRVVDHADAEVDGLVQ
eukprot:gene2551-biopygen15589